MSLSEYFHVPFLTGCLFKAFKVKYISRYTLEGAPIKTLIIYDTEYGNTETIARAIGSAIGADIKIPRFGELTSAELCSCDLLIVGSPTQEGRQLASIKILLDNIPEDGLKGRKVAAFDTRHKWKFVRIWGYAASHIAEILRLKGGLLIAPPEGFFVDATKGPLLPGEVERAAAWAKSLVEKADV